MASREEIVNIVENCETFAITTATEPKDVENETSLDDLLAIVKKDLSKSDPFSLMELLESMSEKAVDGLWSTLARTLNSLVEQSNQTEVSEVVMERIKSHLYQFLDCSAHFAATWLSGDKTNSFTGLEALVFKMHGLLFLLEDREKVQNQICKVCERWWLQDRPQRQEVITHLMPVLLIRTLEQHAKDVDIKRVYRLRDMLQCIDLEHPSADVLKQFLLRCFITPHYLRVQEGKRFLVTVMLLEQSFVADIHCTVLSQIYFSQGKRSVVKAFAEVYFKVWRSAEGEFKTAIEEDCIQDMMDKAIHTSDPKMAKSLLELLNNGFHEKKKVNGVDAMLLRLYGSILWRSLQVANATVRHNAASILFHAFPLQNADLPVAESHSLMDKQYSLFHELLKDPCPKVRVVAIEGAARVLSLFWELIPVNTTKSILLALANDLMNDKSSPQVRAATLHGLGYILENPLAQNTLKEVLPHLAPHLHDRSPSVRVAFVKLLLKVKGLKTIKFYHVVEVDHILERVAMDQHIPSIIERLVELIMPSFFPLGVSGTEQVKRALSLVRLNSNASRGFFSNLYRKASVENTCKLCMLLGKWVLAKVNSKNGTNLDALLCGALQAIVLTWKSVAGMLDTPAYGPVKEDVAQVFSLETFVSPLMVFVETQMTKNASENFPEFDHPKHLLLQIAALASPNQAAADALADDLLRDLVSYDPFSETEKEASDSEDEENLDNESHVVVAYEQMEKLLSPSLNCLCTWTKESALLRTATLALRGALQDKDPLTTGMKRTAVETNDTMNFNAFLDAPGPQQMHPLVAVWVFHRLLTIQSARNRMMAQTQQVDSLVTVLAQAVAGLVAFCAKTDRTRMERNQHETMFLAASLYLKILVHKAIGQSGVGKAPDELVSLVGTCEAVMLDSVSFPQLSAFEEPATPAGKPLRQRRRKREGDLHTPSHLGPSSPQLAVPCRVGPSVAPQDVSCDLVVLTMMTMADCHTLGLDTSHATEHLQQFLIKLSVIPSSCWTDGVTAGNLMLILNSASRLLHQVYASVARKQRGGYLASREQTDLLNASRLFQPLISTLCTSEETLTLLRPLIGALAGVRVPRGQEQLVDNLVVRSVLASHVTVQGPYLETLASSLKTSAFANDVISGLVKRLIEEDPVEEEENLTETTLIIACLQAIADYVPERVRESVLLHLDSKLREPAVVAWKTEQNTDIMTAIENIIPANIQLQQEEPVAV